PHIPSLEGPPNDVQALADTLISRYGFPANQTQIRLDGEATRSGIITALEELESRTSAGDTVLIYYSGHGTSRRDPAENWPLPYGTGALVPFDFNPNGLPSEQVERLLVGRTDLRPVLERLDAGGRNVLVLVDACFSGNVVRGRFRSLLPNPARLPRRNIALGALAADLGTASFGALSQAEEAYPYRNVFFLSAAGEHEWAADISGSFLDAFPTFDGLPHGAFSDALLRALTGHEPADTNADGAVSHGELYATIARFMASRGYEHTPVALPKLTEGGAALAETALLAATIKPTTVAPADVRLSVAIDIAADLVRKHLADSPSVRLIDGNATLNLRAHEDRWLLLDASGDLVSRLPANQPRIAAKVILEHAALQRLVALKSGKDSFTVKMELGGRRAGAALSPCDRVRFHLRASSDAQYYVYVIDQLGEVGLLYPYNAREATEWPAGEVLRFPPGAGDEIQVQPPFGTDHVFALAIARPGQMNAALTTGITKATELLASVNTLNASGLRWASTALRLVTVPNCPVDKTKVASTF
ncbi:MAG: hypothetical protein ACI8W7_004792, partial [Gammaproteobacteria bacterium]